MSSIEIERKFLVNSSAFKQEASSQQRIIQGYLSSVPERTVRVRIKDEQAFLTIKGIGNASGMSRFEWEKAISLDDAHNLLPLCESGIIDKTRYIIDFKGLIFEVDEFYGENLGLVIAEVELESESQSFVSPAWLSEEVTGDKRYYNAVLRETPFLSW